MVIGILILLWLIAISIIFSVLEDFTGSIICEKIARYSLYILMGGIGLAMLILLIWGTYELICLEYIKWNINVLQSL